MKNYKFTITKITRLLIVQKARNKIIAWLNKRSKEQHWIKTEIFSNIINVFTVLLVKNYIFDKQKFSFLSISFYSMFCTPETFSILSQDFDINALWLANLFAC